MKPFNLEAALKGAKVVTRNGNKVEIGCYNKEYNSLLGWVDRVPYTWTGGGKSGRSDDTEELFMAPTERKEWVVVYRDKYGNATNSSVFAEYPNYVVPGNTTIHEITIHE
jgi:hypothetical protein